MTHTLPSALRLEFEEHHVLIRSTRRNSFKTASHRANCHEAIPECSALPKLTSGRSINSGCAATQANGEQAICAAFALSVTLMQRQACPVCVITIVMMQEIRNIRLQEY